ncbi:unnamed protein product [Rotaria socialis]|uniref:Peptide chain release factor domain-containing protein n=1 Tax=Rotaria socialis TaxID=392032 RepID=A0A818T1I7_9BILA|nr:unnamed protein product [Rotaria socialis]CAF3368532.1 unnamed protein product [Rotaria socialis]CAF3448343.1 unnamed protein product [Rotaria socialis]CAF3575986.1 unnamed protein product [Rotaria socialis]CAF3678553.1 unnamed protein product [Rotaria socialis]
MWNICLKRLSFMIFSRRTLATNKNSIMENVIERLSMNYKKELDQLKINENDSPIERIQYLKTILQTMKFREKILQDIDETQKLSNENHDDDISQMATDELVRLRTNLNSIDNEILDHVLPEALADKDDAEIEVAAGVGGQEAMLFAKELFQMYSNYANFRKWSFEIVEYDKTDIGGLRQGKAFINGLNVFKSLKYECGVHRVQRVPQTEKSGRIHTSTVMVAVLPQPKDIKIELPAKDLLAEPIRARGPGGQHVNKSESGCRLTHLPTGIVLERQDDRFFNLNKNIAIKAMKNKLYQMQYDEQQERLFRTRKQQIGSGNRNEKIRTYNIPQNRITDERLDENAHHVGEFLDGTHRLHSMIEQLKQQDRLQRLIELTNKSEN